VIRSHIRRAEKAGLKPKTYGPIALPKTQPGPICPTPNDNDSELTWLWKLVDALEPVIYLSTQNASFNNRWTFTIFPNACTSLRVGERSARARNLCFHGTRTSWVQDLTFRVASWPQIRKLTQQFDWIFLIRGLNLGQFWANPVNFTFRLTPGTAQVC
jgi:hypothetical protein